MAVSLTMLIGGVFIERKRAYAIFARGLIGGGWAALYFTTYAMHALPAAKVIDNPYVATALLLAVACGMILHSLRYKSQTVSGLAYFIAFATLALSESTPFSVLALLPLAASLLYLAHRFEWNRMAVFGLFATYATCASRPDVGAPLASTQALFAMYWLLFETFDLFRLRRSTASWTIESLILPINAFGFLGLSIVKWQRSSPRTSLCVLRRRRGCFTWQARCCARDLRPPSTFDADSGTLDRIAGGSYEGPITLSAGLAAAAILLRAGGEWINVGLLIEGEILFLAGLRFGQRYLRRLAGAAFLGSVIKPVLVDQFDRRVHRLRRTHLDQLVAHCGVVRGGVLCQPHAARRRRRVLYSSVAAGLVAMVLGYETPHQYLCVAWLVFAALLFEVGFRLRTSWSSDTSPTSLARSVPVRAWWSIRSARCVRRRSDWPLAWLPLAICAALHYAATLRISLSDGDDRLERCGEENLVDHRRFRHCVSVRHRVEGCPQRATSALPGCWWARFCSNSACESCPNIFAGCRTLSRPPAFGTCSGTTWWTLKSAPILPRPSPSPSQSWSASP